MWFRRKKGVDNKILRKTKYWSDVENLVDTDVQTQEKLVQYIYEQVSDAMMSELNRAHKETDRMTLIQEVRSYFGTRIEMLKQYKEMIYGKNEKS